MTRSLAFTCALLASALCGAETIYQSTDKNGNPVFTDQPQPAAKAIEVQPTNTTPNVQLPPKTTPAPEQFKGYDSVQVGVSSSIPNGLAPTTIGILLQPALQPGHRWQLSLDGAVMEQGTGTSVTIQQLERGPHRFLLQVFGSDGALLASSPDTEVFVYWPGGKSKAPQKGPKAP